MTATSWASPTLPKLLSKLGGPSRLEQTALAELARWEGTPVGVACSGGPDSVLAACLVRTLHGGPITLLHFNHHLRGEAADADEAFVRELAAKLGCDFRVGHWQDASADATETAAREARLSWLHGWEYPLLVFGHHADDVAETFLMRLARGAGPEGLFAPHAVNKVGSHIHIRPLLPLRKAEIIALLNAEGVPSCTDATNAGDDYLRNRIRNQLLPLWQSFESRDVVAGILASRESLRELYEPATAPSEAPETLSASDNPASYASTSLAAGSTLLLPNGMSLSAELVSAPALNALKADSRPAERVWVRPCASLIVRPWARGERYTPLGAPGGRKIKELLNASDEASALGPAERALWPVVCDGVSGEPLWVPALRPTATAAVPADASQALELRFERR
jgi:tRNA(Ile)-lysidine synthetase-like protein